MTSGLEICYKFLLQKALRLALIAWNFDVAFCGTAYLIYLKERHQLLYLKGTSEIGMERNAIVRYVDTGY